MMKKFGMLFLGLVAVVLVTGCGATKETNQKLVCTSTQNQEGMNFEQVISMSFKNDKLNYMTMDVKTKITDDAVKENWTAFVETMDEQNKESDKDGVSLKVTKDDQNYEYKVTLDIDVENATKEALEAHDFGDLKDDSSTLEDNKKSAEKDGFTCVVK